MKLLDFNHSEPDLAHYLGDEMMDVLCLVTQQLHGSELSNKPKLPGLEG